MAHTSSGVIARTETGGGLELSGNFYLYMLVTEIRAEKDTLQVTQRGVLRGVGVEHQSGECQVS